jgi:hypothetical protein
VVLQEGLTLAYHLDKRLPECLLVLTKFWQDVNKTYATEMSPDIESQMLWGIPSRKRSLLDKRCTMARSSAATSEKVMAAISSQCPV